MNREQFTRERSEETLYTPPCFRLMEEYNLKGESILGTLHSPPHLGVLAVKQLLKKGAQILDIRSPTGFAAGHIPGSLSKWRDGIPTFAGWYLDYERPGLIIDDFNLDTDLVVRYLIRMGYDRIAGYLAGGFPAWSKGAQEIGSIRTCTGQQLDRKLPKESAFILDVRDIRNYRSFGHITGAYHCYVGKLPLHLDRIPRNQPIIVTCDTGFKGSLAASFLAIHHYHDITKVLGSMQAWTRAGFPVEKTG